MYPSARKTRATWFPPRQEGADPLPEPGRIIYQPGWEETSDEEENQEEQKDDSGMEPTPQQQEPGLRRSGRNPVSRAVMDLHTVEKAYERMEYSLIAGSVLGATGTGSPGEAGYMPPDPANYSQAVCGPDADAWKESMRDEGRSLVEHDVFDWVDLPEGAQALPAKYLFKVKYNQDREPVRLKSRIVVQGFHQADAGEDKAAPVEESMETVHPLVANAAQNGFVLKQADIITAFLHARVPKNAKPIL